MAEYEGANLFLNIPVRVAHDNRLKDKDKLLYGEIYAMLNVTNSFFMSNSKLAERLNCSEPTIKRSLARLEECGFIKRNNVYEGKQIVRRTISLGRINSEPRVGSTMILPPVHERSEGRVTSDPDNRTINRSSNRAEEDILSGKPDHATYKEILDYLNSKTGTRYRSSSKATQRLIKARSNEGFEVEDFKRVIDNKVASWGKDPKMSQYLRPTTLFGPKFEAYLNEQAVIDQPTKRAKGYTF